MIHVVRQIIMDSPSSAWIHVQNQNKVALVKAPQQMRRPHIVLDLESTVLERSIQGIARETYNILAYVTATTIEEAWNYHSHLKDLLDEYTGTVTVDGTDYDVARIALRDVTTDAHELHEYYVVALMFDLYVL